MRESICNRKAGAPHPACMPVRLSEGQCRLSFTAYKCTQVSMNRDISSESEGQEQLRGNVRGRDDEYKIEREREIEIFA